MKHCYITFRSITFAQQGERLMNLGGIPAQLLRTPAKLRERGCSYCLRVREDRVEAALELLHHGKIQFNKVYTVGMDGAAEGWA